ncbi:hypothetical protein AJ80_10023 [Polytolypa hystricis UAMH7299]|uniref:Luciferase domain-containing protein n=1 Tax=Polytolypa hystricis (strain UAMH7299) TaxID=1447883 RepID=A0A2B7WEU6_POLH7|nr:hypothetical protein AJ80_10023 [Polytolypa hystricis UAMH7299]
MPEVKFYPYTTNPLYSRQTQSDSFPWASLDRLFEGSSADDYPVLQSTSSLVLFSTCVALLLTISAYRVRKGYHAFLALGPGGTPSTFAGYMRICVLRIFALKNPLSPPSISPHLHPPTGILKDFPKRQGPRPKVVGIAPQRQMTHRGSAEIYAALTTEIKAFTQRYPDHVFLGTSCFEKHSTGLFSVSKVQNRFTCNGEVCHSHPSDGSLHLTLHPADVKQILERGWGERHPLARENWWWRFRFVPPGFVLIYSPRTMEELRCVVEIIHAAAWWISGMELQRPSTKPATSVGLDGSKEMDDGSGSEKVLSCREEELDAAQARAPPLACDIHGFSIGRM